jgi:hypothetical protein
MVSSSLAKKEPRENHVPARGSLPHSLMSACIRDLQTPIQTQYFRSIYPKFSTVTGALRISESIHACTVGTSHMLYADDPVQPLQLWRRGNARHISWS